MVDAGVLAGPKGGRIANHFVNFYISALVVVGWLFALVRWLPEIVLFGGTQFLLWAVYATLRADPKEKPEPLFPPVSDGTAVC